MQTFKCSNCQPLEILDKWSNERKTEFANEVRKHGVIIAAAHFRPIEMNIGEKKHISMHITKEKGFCHYCREEFAEYEGQCAKCGRLNLD